MRESLRSCAHPILQNCLYSDSYPYADLEQTLYAIAEFAVQSDVAVEVHAGSQWRNLHAEISAVVRVSVVRLHVAHNHTEPQMAVKSDYAVAVIIVFAVGKQGMIGDMGAVRPTLRGCA